ncbi:hypothetical protein HDU82_006258 [Entophlyctis luteolus]|nr:hypothetical protein HDU82_006258 [Entophlyctis luteolus]
MDFDTRNDNTTAWQDEIPKQSKQSSYILKASAITILENARSSTEDTSLKKEIDASNHPFCEVDFDIAFEFNSVLYARVTDMFFDQVCLTMVESFVTRMESVYGKANALK